MNNKINIIGMGPGHRDYLLPAAVKCLEDSDIIVGAERHLKILRDLPVTFFELTSPLEETITFIKNNCRGKKISIAVSGDTGFYSMLNLVKKNFGAEELNVIPGISTMQYFFSRLGIPWHDASLVSLHGRDVDIIDEIRSHDTVFILTDAVNTYKDIAGKCVENNLSQITMHIGADLSYDNESIYTMQAKEALYLDVDSDLIVVILEQ